MVGRPSKGKPTEDASEDALVRMNKALKAALETPPKPHKDEPKRRSGSKPPKKS